jgi:hypothetical protein
MPRPGNYIDRSDDPVGPFFDLRNNVFYNWGGSYSGYNADTDSMAHYNFIANYYVAGPDSTASIAFDESNPHASLYVADTWMDGRAIVDPLEVVNLPKHGALAAKPFDAGKVRTTPADEAFSEVLESAGASRVRDAVDERVIEDVRNGSGHIINAVAEVGGWPELASNAPAADADSDGMPDSWERQNGLDATNPEDGASDPDGDGYTNLEDYINSLATH